MTVLLLLPSFMTKSWAQWAFSRRPTNHVSANSSFDCLEQLFELLEDWEWSVCEKCAWAARVTLSLYTITDITVPPMR